MNSKKEEQIKEALRDAAAEFLIREANRISLITVTSVSVFDRGTKATIYVTVYPEKDEATVLDFLKRKRSDFKHFVENETRIMRPPHHFDFEIDLGEKNRQRIDELSNNS
jgi:ribosome-binding factor A